MAVSLLGLSGSLREGSYNRRLLGAAAAELPHGVSLDLFEQLGDISAYREGSPAPAAVEALRETIAGADGVLIATPEYNSSIPGLLKNALDWASRPWPDNCLRGKPVAVVGASTGLFGAVWAQAELRKVLTYIGAEVIDSELPVGQAHEAFTPDGRLGDSRLRSGLAGVVTELLNQVHRDDEQTA